MDFELSEDQSMLLAPCERLLRERCTFEARRREIASAADQKPPLWQDISELGLTALMVPEDAGGLGRPLIDAALVAQALGRGWLLEPFIDAALVAPRILATALPAGAVRDEQLAQIASGAIVIALFESELDGSKLSASVAHASYADQFLVLIGSRLMKMDAGATQRSAYRQFDGCAAARVEFNITAAEVLVDGDLARSGWRAGHRAARIGRIAEGLGLARSVLDLTTEYLRTRKQFGQPLGRFQALAHRMADLLVGYESAQSLMLAAAMKADEPDGDRMIDAAEVIAHRALRSIGQQSIQLHGGIGMTDEYALSHYVKRLLGVELELGDVDSALRRFASA